MNVSTINIPLQNDILAQVDQIANDEARTRADLISDAVRIYVERDKDDDDKLECGIVCNADILLQETMIY